MMVTASKPAGGSIISLKLAFYLILTICHALTVVTFGKLISHGMNTTTIKAMRLNIMRT